jgi:hypothetical protein
MTEDSDRLRLRLELACEEALEHLKRGQFQEAPSLLQPVIDEFVRDEDLAVELSAELDALIDVAGLCAARNPHRDSLATEYFGRLIQLRLRTLKNSNR